VPRHCHPLTTDRPNAMRLTRLTERSQFLAAASKGRRFRASGFTAQVRDRDGNEAGPLADQTALRIGLTASRHVGNAPVRNRIRRRLRAAALLALGSAAEQPVDLVLVARRELLAMPFERLKTEIAQSIARARPVAPGQSRNKSHSQAHTGTKSSVQPEQKR
jgi:ribonuclease P protein component